MEGGCCLFGTPLGRCGIAWAGEALRAIQLPEADEAAMLARLRLRAPTAPEGRPPAFVAAAIRRIQGLLAGEPDGLGDVPLDFSGVPAFHRQVYALARAIPPGEVRTYGELARGLGRPGASRAVGQALGHNPFAPVVPCHRVLAAGGRAGGFSAEGGAATKLKLLEIERARFGGLFD